MRISLLNTRFFMIGGDTRYTLNIHELLGRMGHAVVPFSNRYSDTVETPYLDYFVPPPGGDDRPFYKETGGGLAQKLALLERSTYSREVKRAFGRLLDAESIELAFSVNICNYLGPSVIDAARERGLPYVMRLSDYNLLCPSYHYVRDGRACEDCRGGLIHAVKNRCLQDSVAVSAARVLSMWVQRAIGVYGRVTRIVTPSAFLKGKLVEAGFDGERIDHIPTFVDLDLYSAGDDHHGNEIVYAGRLAEEKGVETLVTAATLLPQESPLRVVLLGTGEEAYVQRLKTLADAGAPGRVEFAGFVQGEQLRRRVGSSLAVAHPSRWYENMPNSVTEAMSMGRPVLASSLGSLPEQVLDGETGRLLDPYEPHQWAEAMSELAANRDRAREWGRAGRRRAEQEYSPQLHHDRLVSTFERARAGAGG